MDQPTFFRSCLTNANYKHIFTVELTVLKPIYKWKFIIIRLVSTNRPPWLLPGIPSSSVASRVRHFGQQPPSQFVFTPILAFKREAYIKLQYLFRSALLMWMRKMAFISTKFAIEFFMKRLAKSLLYVQMFNKAWFNHKKYYVKLYFNY